MCALTAACSCMCMHQELWLVQQCSEGFLHLQHSCKHTVATMHDDHLLTLICTLYPLIRAYMLTSSLLMLHGTICRNSEERKMLWKGASTSLRTRLLVSIASHFIGQVSCASVLSLNLLCSIQNGSRVRTACSTYAFVWQSQPRHLASEGVFMSSVWLIPVSMVVQLTWTCSWTKP